MRLSPRLLRLAVFLVLAIPALPALPAGAAENDSKYEALRRFTQAYEYARRFYVRDVTNAELVSGAIKGMLQSLDPHSTYLSPAEYTAMKESNSGEFFGIGIEISMENGQLIVVSPIEDTPAYKAGLKAGDIIMAVDGTPTQDLSMQEAVSKIRGPKNTEVELLILHKEEKLPSTVRIVRDAIPIISVKTRFLEEGYPWVRITRFSENTTEDLLKGMAEARKRGPIKGIVLDLRNNPGGLLDQAVSVSDVFLKQGEIVSIRERDKEQPRNYKATDQSTDVTEPLVVLVNSGSASASEIVAGALRDHKRGLLIGERTFGKGSVQNVMLMPDGSGAALKLTVALYYTPSGRSIQAEGIEPQLVVPFEAPRDNAPGLPRFNLREKDLSGHLEKGGENSGTQPRRSTGSPKKAGEDKQESEIRAFLEKDNQLRLGLQMVKALPQLRAIR
jgi:carboxyl-terminal processing protease